MYGKALFGLILVVFGAVLPFLLADEKLVSKAESWISSEPQPGVTTDDAGQTFTSKPTTAGKLVTVPVSKKAVQSPVSSARSSGFANANTRMDTASFSAAATSVLNAPVPNRPRQELAGRQLDLPRLVGPPGVPIEHLLSFEVTPEWVRENWSRVTTRLAELELQGWRAPISLDDAYDLTGSVTYYFDRQRQVQRILLHGYTSNPGELARLAVNRYRMRRVPHASHELYLHNVEGSTLGGLHVDNSAVVKTAGQTEVLMELNRAGANYGTSLEFQEKLRHIRRQDEELGAIPEYDFLSPQTRLPGTQESTTQRRLRSSSTLLDSQRRTPSSTTQRVRPRSTIFSSPSSPAASSTLADPTATRLRSLRSNTTSEFLPPSQPTKLPSPMLPRRNPFQRFPK